MIDNPTRPIGITLVQTLQSPSSQLNGSKLGSVSLEPSLLGLQRTIEDWETDPAQDAALDAALVLDDGPAATRILAAIQAGTWTR